jgi:hypothetical protein
MVNGVVAARDKRPYIQLSTERGQIAQLTMAEARSFCMDILQMCARTEADAMLVKFFSHHDYPQGACEAMLVQFRDFRAELDDEQVTRNRSHPDEDATGQP